MTHCFKKYSIIIDVIPNQSEGAVRKLLFFGCCKRSLAIQNFE